MSVYGDMLKERMKLSDSSEPSAWISENTFLRGKPYSFKGHEYQIDFINDPHKIVAAKKCAQIGFTEVLIRWMLCFLVQHQGSQTIFTQPTDGEVGKFAKSRLDVLFEACPIIQKLGTGGIDSAYLKRVGSSFLNLRGTFGTKAAISVPSDANVYDEINFSNPRVLSQFKSRLQHSEYKFERLISTPTIPDFGISAVYDKSDQKAVVLKCNHCGHYQFLNFRDNVLLRKGFKVLPVDPDTMTDFVNEPWTYEAFICCSKCHLEVDRNWYTGKREWVAKYPERAQDLETGTSGYYISQLDVEFVNATNIVKASDSRFPEGYSKEQDFVNFVLGEHFTGADGARVNEEVKKSAIVQMEEVNQASGTFIGIDLGMTCHVVVVKPIFGELTVITAFTISHEELADFYKIMKRFGALFTVSDALPYTTTVTALAKREDVHNRLKICYFSGKKEYSIDKIRVLADRTQCLDTVVEGLCSGSVKVTSQADDEFWDHCYNLVRVKQEDDYGTITFRYVKIGPDHYGLALGYALLAEKIFREHPPEDNMGGCAPIEISHYRTTL